VERAFVRASEGFGKAGTAGEVMNALMSGPMSPQILA